MKKLAVLIGFLVAANVALVTFLRDDDSVSVESAESPDSSFRLQWDRTPDPRVTEYHIYVTEEKGNYSFGEPTAVVPSDVTEWRVSGLPAGRYFAVVTAVSANSESPPTDAIEFTLPE